MRLHIARKAYSTAQENLIKQYKKLPNSEQGRLTYTRFLIESALPGTPKEIAERLGFDIQRVYRLLDQYERRLLISHHGPPRNRVYQVRLNRWQMAFDSDEMP